MSSGPDVSWEFYRHGPPYFASAGQALARIGRPMTTSQRKCDATAPR
ncbi:MAG: hypothetical protein JWO31_3551, partial [Phycisphaerales bacterium]|nr:hypothetical protein [Phycisphaerales bacterium]